MTLRLGPFILWPRSLAARTALVLLLGLAVVQVAGLTIHALDRVDLQRIAAMHDLAGRIMGAYRAAAVAPPLQRDAVLRELEDRPQFSIGLTAAPPADDLPPMPPPQQRLLQRNMAMLPLPGPLRPRDFVLLGGHGLHRLVVGLRLPDAAWLTVRAELPPPSFWHATNFLLSFALMTAAAALLTLWAVRRLTAPVRTLAAAAEALGRDVNAPPLPEAGPTEVATAAAAFNTMAARIRRFVQDRTVMLTAIGHDLRTPITRLKLRAEFMEDEEQRRKMLADLDEMEAMVAATLAFGRDAAAEEPASALDLAELCRTLLDEAGDAQPEIAGELAYAGPPHLTVRARPLALKRALGNLVSNAVTYGGGAHIHMSPPRDKILTLEITDHGPGLPPAELERVFEPFRRLEASRNRETGGMGLGLPIARNILRAHGGDVVLVNPPKGGAKAIVTLPI